MPKNICNCSTLKRSQINSRSHSIYQNIEYQPLKNDMLKYISKTSCNAYLEKFHPPKTHIKLMFIAAYKKCPIKLLKDEMRIY